MHKAAHEELCRAMRLARRSSSCAALCITANQAVPAVSLNSQPSTLNFGMLAHQDCGCHSESSPRDESVRLADFRERPAACTVWRFEALVAVRHSCSCLARRCACCAHRLDFETKTLAAWRALFFSSRGAG